MTTAPASFNGKQIRDAHRILDSLDRMDARLKIHYDRQRRHERRAFRAVVTVRIALPEVPGCDVESREFQALARDISCGGLSFIHPERLWSNEIRVCLNPEATPGTWFRAEIVRARPVHDGFHEYGVRLIERASG